MTTAWLHHWPRPTLDSTNRIATMYTDSLTNVVSNNGDKTREFVVLYATKLQMQMRNFWRSKLDSVKHRKLH